MIHPVNQKELRHDALGILNQVSSNLVMKSIGLVPSESPECVYVKKNDCILSVHSRVNASTRLVSEIEQLEIQVHNMRKGK